MNISELARRLRTNPDELREKLPALGFDVGSRAIKVDDRLVGKIMARWNEMKKKERLRAKYKREEKIKEEAVARVKKVKLPKAISVRDFAQLLGLPINIVIAELMNNGILASVNERIDFDTASIIADDLGYEVVAKEDDGSEDVTDQEIKAIIGEGDKERLEARPPVVVVMGHVDHGKTALLDAIRKTSVAAQEAGGITQHIGAYQVNKKDRDITFLDTPGHEAFTVMRSRGAKVADVAILVVAADDGVQPQTLEVIKIVQAAKLPLVVALNKIDKPDIDLQKVKTELSKHDLIPEDWGGKTVMVPVSAKTGQGIDELLDMILLVADLDKDRIRADRSRRAVGTIIESHVDKGEGPVATVLVQTGTLRLNDELAVRSQSYGRVRAMKNWHGQAIDQAPPGTPVKALGFKVAPQVGDIVQVPEAGRELKKVRKQYGVEKQVATVAKTQGDEEEGEKKYLNIVLKADVLGSLEAIIGTLEKMKTDEVAVAIVGKGLGNITDSDVMRAEATGGVVFGFNVLSTKEAELLARDQGVEIKSSKVIYDLFDEAKRRLQEMVPAEVIRTDLGKLETLAVFKADKSGQIVGGRVKEGKVTVGANVVLYRGEEPIDEGKVLQLQSGKSDVQEIKQGQECGIKVSCRTTILTGDTMEFSTEERKEKRIALPV